MKISEISSSVSGLGKNYTSLVNSLGDVTNEQSKTNGAESFSQVLKNSIHELNNSQVTAYEAMNDIATGKVENLQEAVQKIEEAELSLKLGLEVKNKALGAYKQIMSMQI